MFKTIKDLDTKQLNYFINKFKTTEQPRLINLKKQYDNKNTVINSRQFADSSAVNNKIAVSLADYIVTLINSYFVGKPVLYNSKNEDLKSIISNLNKTNDETNENIILATNLGIFGIAYELIYYKDKQLYFNALEPQNTFCIYDDSLKPQLKYVVRLYDVEMDENLIYNFAEVYTGSEIIKYKAKNNALNYTLDSRQSHNFKCVPVIPYRNNLDCIGDFEKVMKLLDAFDFCMSDSVNDNDTFNNTYMLWKNAKLAIDEVLNADTEENTDTITASENMKATRNICIEDKAENMKADLSFVSKPTNQFGEQLKDRLLDLILKLTYIDSLTQMKSHTSAESSKNNTLPLESKVSIKESYFRKGLMERYRIILDFIALTDTKHDINDIDITIKRNIPKDDSVMADTIVKLKATGVVSDKTLLEMLAITDVQTELKRLEEQRQLEKDMFNNYPSNFGGSDVIAE